MAVFLERINAAPILDLDLTFEFLQWLTTLVDSLNTTIEQIQDGLNAVSNNGLIVPSYTTVEIAGFAVDAPNGTMWYDTDLDELQAKVNGVVVVIA